MRGIGWTTAIAAVAIVCSACASADLPDDDSVPAATAPAGLPDVEPGRLTRLLGDGTGHDLSAAARVPDTPLGRPTMLVPDGDDVYVLQESGGFLLLRPDGSIAPNPAIDIGGFVAVPIAAVARADDMLVLTHEAAGQATVTRIDLTGRSASTTAPIAAAAGTDGPSAFLDLPGGMYLAWGSTWWNVTMSAGHPVVTPAEPPVSGGLGAARTADGVAVLTPTEVVHLDASLSETGRYSWRMPGEWRDATVHQTVSDGADGVYVVVSGDPQPYGAVLHVGPEGVSPVVQGVRPPAPKGSGRDCDDADTEALDAHIGGPRSVALWHGRLLVADYECSSVLQAQPTL